MTFNFSKSHAENRAEQRKLNRACREANTSTKVETEEKREREKQVVHRRSYYLLLWHNKVAILPRRSTHIPPPHKNKQTHKQNKQRKRTHTKTTTTTAVAGRREGGTPWNRRTSGKSVRWMNNYIQSQPSAHNYTCCTVNMHCHSRTVHHRICNISNLAKTNWKLPS